MTLNLPSLVSCSTSLLTGTNPLLKQYSITLWRIWKRTFRLRLCRGLVKFIVFHLINKVKVRVR